MLWFKIEFDSFSTITLWTQELLLVYCHQRPCNVAYSAVIVGTNFDYGISLGVGVDF
jgi:hypothetical protein